MSVIAQSIDRLAVALLKSRQEAVAEIEALTKEKCALVQEINDITREIVSKQKTIERLTLENRELQKAAARWHFVRDNARVRGEPQEGVYRWSFDLPDVNPESIEADADAAIAANANGGPTNEML